MNQILVTKSKTNKEDTNSTCPQSNQNGYFGACPKNKKKDWFKFQFTFSICIIIMSIFCASFYLYQLSKKEDFSDKLLANYNIYRLYSSRRRFSGSRKLKWIIWYYRNSKN